MRNIYTSFEIYELGRMLGVDISRSVLHWYRSKGIFTPKGKFYKHFVYDVDDVIGIVLRLAKKRKIEMNRDYIEEVLEELSEKNKVLMSA